MAQRFENKVVVVTGGSEGIGLTTAKSFAAEGAQVYITGRNEDRLDTAIGEIGNGVTGVQGTVRELSYFGSFTVYHLALASGAVLKVSQGNVDRHPDDVLSWGDTAWASWAPNAQVVLTQ